MNLKKKFEFLQNSMQWNTKMCQRLTTTNPQLKFVAKIISASKHNNKKNDDNESDIGKCERRTNKETNLNDKIIFGCVHAIKNSFMSEADES